MHHCISKNTKENILESAHHSGDRQLHIAEHSCDESASKHKKGTLNEHQTIEDGDKGTNFKKQKQIGIQYIDSPISPFETKKEGATRGETRVQNEKYPFVQYFFF